MSWSVMAPRFLLVEWNSNGGGVRLWVGGLLDRSTEVLS